MMLKAVVWYTLVLYFSVGDLAFVRISKTICEVRHEVSVLNCSNKNWKEIPDFNKIRQFTQEYSKIKEIDLSKNKIYKFDPTKFDIFKKLQVLRLNGNKLDDKSFNVTDTKSLKKLKKLYLDQNKFTSVPSKFLRTIPKLRYLSISGNPIKRLHNDVFSGMKEITKFDIFTSAGRKQKPVNVDVGAFRHMKSLELLDLVSFNVRIKEFPDLNGTNNLKEITLYGIQDLKIPDDFCDDHKKLEVIVIQKCSMTIFPSLNKCINLRRIEVAENQIEEVTKYAFSGLPHIEAIDIFRMKNTVTKIHMDAFSNLSSLKELDLSHSSLKTFPNLRGTRSLRKLSLQFCSLSVVPADFCDDKPELLNLDLNQNNIRTLPSLSKCSQLQFLDLYQNKILTLTNEFDKLTNLNFLKLSDNHLTKIPASLFGSLRELRHLNLSQNVISHIDKNAFVNITKLRILDVSRNKLRNLPYKGLQAVTDVIANQNKGMIRFPTQQELPHAKRLVLDYHYHCCFFLKRVQQIHRIFALSPYKSGIIGNPIIIKNIHSIDGQNSSLTSPENADNIDPFIRYLQQINNHTKLLFNMPSTDAEQEFKEIINTKDDGYCFPTPNEFYPCEDLMGKEWLRYCVWIVFFLALLGNITVLFVLFLNYTKIDVPRYLVINLAFADLCLGIYLGFLAFVDMKTIGDFRQHALDWQFSGSCKFAGFLAVFSSELSVYTLTAITIERFLTIKNSMYVDKRMSRNQAFFSMSIGWLISFIIAVLPLFNGHIKFNDYTKYSVCLPFETETLASRVYLMCLLGLNLFAFVVILYCYVKIYLYIRGSNAWNSGDSRVARRMAILVFTDFLCWFPIALIALSAVFKNPFISDLWISKVITIFIFPLNACANPFLYAIFTKQFRKDFMSVSRHIKDKVTNRREIQKSLLKLPIKGSFTYSTSVRRGSSCSFLFGRRLSSKPDIDAKICLRHATNIQQPFPQDSFEESFEEEFQERLTTL